MNQNLSSSQGAWLKGLIGLVVGLLGCLGALPAAAETDDPEWTANLRWGLEYDDNPARVDAHDGTGDALTRYLLGADIVTDIGPSGQVSATIRHGGKFFRRESGANSLVTEARGAGLWRPYRRLSMQVGADIKDRNSVGEFHDYTRGGTFLRFDSSMGPVRLWADGGARFFAFKPSPISSYRGPRLRFGTRWMVRDDLAADVSVGRSWRFYESTAWELDDGRFVSVGDGAQRSDEYDLFGASVEYRRKFNARLRYSYARNQSNSYGQGLRRHGLEASVTVPIMWDTFVSTRAEVQRTRYEDSIELDDAFRLDEDHRNAFVAALRRPLVGRWEIELRYSLFAHEFGIDDDYRRQTLALSLGINIDNDE